MKGDFSRNTFKPEKHYSSVSMQQGRVQLDADWNEQSDIQSYLREKSSTDIIGLTGIPRENEGFLIEVNEANKDDLTISSGHIYVDGILCECETKSDDGSRYSLLEQPDYSDIDIGKLTGDEALCVIYLDVWQRHISVIEDADIREVALGGPDTATRTKTVWQVKLVNVGGERDSSDYEEYSKDWLSKIEQSNATLSAKSKNTESHGAYRSMENQLYRVEIHDGGERGEATFKWSGDNGSIVTRWIDKVDNVLYIDRQGSDETRWFKSGQLVELTYDEDELNGIPGKIVKIIQSGKDSITIDEDIDDTFEIDKSKTNPKIIRWDIKGEEAINVHTENSDDPQEDYKWIELENGVRIKFGGEKFRTGDYWLIPARTSTAGIEWPVADGEPKAEPPRGINHHYCRLATVKYAASKFKVLSDNRRRFPSLTELKGFGAHPDAPHESVYIDENGNVGIGTLEPESKLDVHGSVSVEKDLIVEGNLEVQGETTEFSRIAKAGNILLGDHNEDRITIHGTLRSKHTSRSLEVGDDKKETGLHVTGSLIVDKNVGIGTSAPESRLHVSEGDLRLDAGREIFFKDSGQIRSHNDNHRILFRRNENKLELREYGDIIFSPGATVGTETAHVYLKSNGNVGIGTTNPRRSLDVNGEIIAENRLTLAQDSGLSSETWHLDNLAGRFRIFDQPNIDTAGTERLTITTNGNVGIGTTSPISPLHIIKDTGSGDAVLRLRNTNPSKVTRLQLEDSTGRVGDGLIDYVHREADKSKHYMALGVNGGALFLQNGGNVGIGTTNPTSLVHVLGGGTMHLEAVGLRISRPDNRSAYMHAEFSRGGGANFAIDTVGDGLGNAKKWILYYQLNTKSLTLDNSGNVGIGTTDPRAKLEINSGQPDSAPVLGVSTPGFEDFVALSGGRKNRRLPHIAWKRGALRFGTASSFGGQGFSEKMRVTETGDVGIGTAPDTGIKLHINGSVRGSRGGALRIDTGQGLVDIGPMNSSYSHFITDRPKFYFNKPITVNGEISSYVSRNLSLQTNGNTRIEILESNGNVGIGTTSPGAKLDVNGTIRAINFEGDGSALTGLNESKWSDGTNTSIYYDDSNVGIRTDDPSKNLDVKASGDSEGIRLSHQFGNGPVAELLQVGGDGHLNLYTGQTTTVKRIHISAHGNSWFSPTGNGNVGIGTVSPGAKLDVNGTIRATNFKGDGSALTGLNESKWLEGANTSIYYDDGNVGIGTDRFSPRMGLSMEIRKDNPYGRNMLRFTNKALRISGTENVLEFGFEETGPYNTSALMRVVHDGGTSASFRFDTAYPGGNAQYTRLIIHPNGNVWAQGISQSSSDYAEYFESMNGKEIPAGTSVILENGKVRPARKADTPMGIISANPGVLGGANIEWSKKYLTDIFGTPLSEKHKDEIMVPKTEKVKRDRQKIRKKIVKEKVTRTEILKKGSKYRQVELTETVTREIEEPVLKEVDLYAPKGNKIIGKHIVPVMETYEEEVDVLDENGEQVMVGSGKFETVERPKLNPKYDPSKEFIPRENRPEWNCIGLLGQIPLRKGQPVADGWVKIMDISDKVELWLVK